MISSLNRKLLLQVARQSILAAVQNIQFASDRINTLPVEIQQEGACFVTLTRNGSLRGCIGSLEANQPLYLDVIEHAADAAIHDFRFPPVSKEEASDLHIEISVLSKPVSLPYSNPLDLPSKLQPGVDGVILAKGLRKATFLPQVWEQIPEPELFLSHLCEKMGAVSGLWRSEVLRVQVYQVECFEEDLRDTEAE